MDDDAVTDFLIWGVLFKHIHQIAVVGHLSNDIGMRPVSSPDDAVGGCFYQSSGKWYNIIKGVVCIRKAFCPGYFYPKVIIPDKLQYPLKGGLF
jgi:hypothetical protein